MDPASLTALTALAVAVGGLLLWAARHAWRVARRVIHFLDDYAGQPARDGMAARPGVMARLGSAEDTLRQVLAELQPNHGTSMRDVVHQTAADVAVIKSEQAAVRTRLERFDAQHSGSKENP